ncbi:EamA family transporter [Rhodocaloribacter sp.]
MLYLMLAVACNLAIAMILKYAGRQGMDRVAMLAANYATAVILAVFFLTFGGVPAGRTLHLDPGLVALGVFAGTLFIENFFIYAYATHVAGMSLAIAVMRVAVVIPFMASWWIWGETPTPTQGAGLLLATVAFFLIAQPKRGSAGADPGDREPGRHRGRIFAVLALLFLGSGLVDVSLKTFDEVYASENSRALFLLMLFGVALLIGSGFVVRARLRTGRWPSRRTLRWGVLLGLVNYGSAAFFLRAIRELSGPFVFPVNHISLVIGGALLGVLVWDERLSRVNMVGLGLAAAALVLLSV